MGKTLSFDDINNKLNECSTLQLISIDGTKYESKAVVHCNKCGATYDTVRGAIIQWHGCSVCAGKLVIKGINDIATTAPWMMEYLVDKNVGYNYMRSSGKRVSVKCPMCNRVHTTTLNNLDKRGFTCSFCNDGISYPNKFIRNFLTQFDLDCLEFEYSPDWIKPKRFDSYFVLNGKQYIVEMDGSLHFKDNTFGGKVVTKEDVQSLDTQKQSIAENRGIEVIRINCDDILDIPNQIKLSKLNNLFDLSNFDFNECQIKSMKSELLNVCKDWESGSTVYELSKKYYVSDTSIRKWLRRGVDLGICNYTYKESLKRGRVYANNQYSKSKRHLATLKKKEEYKARIERNKLNRQIYVYKDNELIMVCDNYTDCARKIGEMLNNPKACKQNIISAVKDNRIRYGFTYKTYQMVQQEQSLQKEININERK